MNKYLKNIILILLICFPVILSGQVGKTFWFVAPDISSGYGQAGSCDGGDPKYLLISTLNVEADITISQPANIGFTPVTFHLDAWGHKQIDLSEPGCFDGLYTSIENTPADQVNNFGILIEATQYINASYIVKSSLNQETWVLKGDNALGDDFWVPTQMIFDAATSYTPEPRNEIHIVATEDNTNVHIWLPTGVAAIGHGAGTDWPVTLNEGQTYGIKAANGLGAGHLSGTHITSDDPNKPIAITVSDDGITNVIPCANYDANGDQLVSVDDIGNEYIVMKSQIDGTEWVSVLATQDNTEIRIGAVLVTTINQGDTYSFSITDNTHIATTEDVYVYHLAGVGCEMGGALVPPIPCKGSSEVFFTRKNTQPLYIYLMVPLGSEDNFTIEYEDGSTYNIPIDEFELVNGSTAPQYMAIKPSSNSLSTAFFNSLIPPNETVRIFNTERNFTMGFLNAGEITGANYGYISNYSDIELDAEFVDSISTSIHTCFGDSIQMLATGGLSYYWSRLGGGGFNYLNNNTISHPIATPPAGVHNYQVIVTGDCNQTDTFQLSLHMGWELEAQFHIADPIICHPDSIEITNTTVGYDVDYSWDFSDHTTDTISDSLFYRSINILEDTTLYEIILAVSDTFQCVDTLRREVTVYDSVAADFILPANLDDCHPFSVPVSNASVGDIGTFKWDFGDMSGSTLAEPGTHIYNNYKDTIVDYIISLVAISPNLCTDTIQDTVKVYPYITSDFVVNKTEFCSPDTLIITNNSSGAIDSTIWSFGDSATVITPRPDTSSVIYVVYSNTSNSTITNSINVRHLNLYGNCESTFSRSIKIYPEIIAGFIPRDTSACSPFTVNFTDTSNTVAVTSDNYDWVFGDGGSTNIQSPTHTYLNNGTTDITFNVKLTTTSSNNCTSSDSSTITVHPYVYANFTIDKPDGCAIFTVNIENQSSGDTETYDWSFGDGTPNSNFSGVTMTHDYDNTTILTLYDTLKLVVTNTEGCSDSTERVISVFPKINTGILASDTAGCNHLQVTLSQDTTSTIIDSYAWDYGDGTNSYDSTSLHEYTNYTSSEVVYTAIRTAITPEGCIDIDSVDITIYPYLEANFTIDVAAGCTPLLVNHELEGSGNITSQNWDFGGAGTSTAADTAFTYINSYTFDTVIVDTVKLWVHNANCSDSLTRLITIYPKPTVSFTISNSAVHCQPYPVTFTNTSDSVSSQYFWEFGDTTSTLTTSHLPPISHTYTNTSRYADTLYPYLIGISNYYCTDTISDTVTVEPFILADFIITGGASSCSPAISSFENISKGELFETDWYFGDGNDLQDEVDTFVFNPYPVNTTGSLATYTVFIVAENSAGCIDTSDTKGVVVYPEVTADFSLVDTVGCHPFVPVFQNFSNNATSPVEYYLWDFEYANQPSKDSLPVGITFRDNYRDRDTSYTITLIVQSEYFCSDTTTQGVYVYYQPYANINVTESSTCSPYTPLFVSNNSIAAPLADYYIQYGDGTDTTVNSAYVPEHTYQNLTTNTNNYIISLLITSDDGCTHKDSTNITVYPEVIADFSVSDSAGCHPFEVIFNSDSTVNRDQVSWDFGDGNTSASNNPQHEYYENSTDGIVYTVTLTAVSENKCSDSTSRNITIYQQPFADFSVPRSRLLMPDAEFDITNRTTPATGNWLFEWEFWEGAGFIPEPSIEFTRDYSAIKEGGEYQITLIASNVDHPECRDTTSQIVIVDPRFPVARLSVDTTEGCFPCPITFYDNSLYNEPDSNIWYLGDTVIYGGDSVIHYYDNYYATFFPKLTVFGDGGDSATDYEVVHIWPLPVPDFDYSPKSSDELPIALMANDIISFNNLTEEYPLDTFSYIWDFGDGNTSDLNSPSHSYETNSDIYNSSTNGKGYRVMLTAITSHGCIDSTLDDTTKFRITIVDEGQMLFPNAFTPNGDGLNDFFMPFYESIRNYKIEIYNRWGMKVFSQEQENISGRENSNWLGWDGYIYKSNGDKTDAKAPPGVYVWKIEGKWQNQLPFEFSGDVTLLRYDPK